MFSLKRSFLIDKKHYLRKIQAQLILSLIKLIIKVINIVNIGFFVTICWLKFVPSFAAFCIHVDCVFSLSWTWCKLVKSPGTWWAWGTISHIYILHHLSLASPVRVALPIAGLCCWAVPLLWWSLHPGFLHVFCTLYQIQHEVRIGVFW